MVTGAFSPAGALNDGQEAMADASDAQDAKIARFSEVESEAFVSTSRGWPNTVPGCRSALKSITLSSEAVVGRMVSSILWTKPVAARRKTRGILGE